MRVDKEIDIADQNGQTATFKFSGKEVESGFLNFEVTQVAVNGIRYDDPAIDTQANAGNFGETFHFFAADIKNFLQTPVDDSMTFTQGATFALSYIGLSRLALDAQEYFQNQDSGPNAADTVKVWKPEGANKLASISDIVSDNTSQRSYKYNTTFVKKFFKGEFSEKPNFNSSASNIQTGGGSSNTDIVRKLSFRIPLTAQYSSDDGKMHWTGNKIGDMEAFLIDDPVKMKLDRQALKFNLQVPALVNYCYGVPEIINGWVAHVPGIFIEVGDKEKYEKLIQEALNAAAGDGSGTGLTDAQKKRSLPLNEQAILLYRMGELLDYNRKYKRNIKEYDRFATLEAEGSKDIEILVNSLTVPPDLSALFEKIRPIHLSALIPRVRLYKKYPFNAKRLAGKGKKDQEPVYIEYEFEEHIDPDLMSSTLTTNTGVGLESFSWDFKGDNPVAAVKQVDAQLKIRAKSVDALEQLRNSSYSSDPGIKTYAFSDIWIPECRRKQNNGTRPYDTDPGARDYEEKKIENAETRVEIEYSVDKSNQIFKTGDGPEIAKALETLKLAINLSIATYELDLKDDGSVGITCTFVGRLDALAKDPKVGNILPDQTFTENQKAGYLTERKEGLDHLATIRQRIAEEQKRQDQFVRAQHRNPTVTDEEKAKTLKEYHERIKELKKRESYYRNTFDGDKAQGLTGASLKADNDRYLRELASNEYSKIKLYRTILNGLIRRKVVHTLVVDPQNVALTHEELKTKSNALHVIRNKDMSLKEQMVTQVNREDASGMGSSKHALVGEFERLSKRLDKDIFPKYTSDAYLIRFFYFGDLIDVVLDNMYTGGGNPQNPNEAQKLDIRTILGPIQIRRNVFDSYNFRGNIEFMQMGDLVVSDRSGTYDPRLTADTKAAIAQIQAENPKKTSVPPPTTQEVIASLADVPISLNLFLRWFSDVVSNKGIFGKSFKKFLTEATNQLIVAALQADSSRLLLPKQVRKIKTINWEAHAKSGEPDPFGFVNNKETGLKITGTTAERITKSQTGSQLAQVRKDIAKLIQFRGGANMSEYVIIYAEPAQPNRKYDGHPAQYANDLDDGVYHLSLGRDVGVVKDIKLSAPTSAEFEAMQLQKASKTDGTIKTKRIYDATVTMFGVTFFRPGQLVFIEPAAYGSLDNLKAHGLCGYYSVISTSNNFTAGRFETTLNCTFISEG